MERKRSSSHRREGVSKRKKNIREDQEGSNTDANKTLQEGFFIDSSEKETELGNIKELDGVGIDNGVVVLDAKLDDKLLKEMRTMKKELEEKINAGFKAVREEIDARFKAVREEICGGFNALREEVDAGFKAFREGITARKEQQKDSIPKSFKAVSGFAPIPVQAHAPEIEMLLKEVTKSTSSEENNSKTKTSSSSEELSSSSSEEAKEVTIVAQKSFTATKKKGSAPTRRSSRIAGK